MTDEPAAGLHIDSDWKEEAAREKARLAAQERADTAKNEAGDGQAQFADLLNVLAMQAAIALGGYQGPGGEQVPPNPAAAKHQIDLLGVLEEKTRGNLTDEEKRTLNQVLYEFRMQFVQATSGSVPPPTQGAGSPAQDAGPPAPGAGLPHQGAGSPAPGAGPPPQGAGGGH